MDQFYLNEFRSPISLVPIYITNSTCTQLFVFSSQNLAVWRSIILKRIRDFLTEGPMYCHHPLSHMYNIKLHLLYCLEVIDLVFPINVLVGLCTILINCECLTMLSVTWHNFLQWIRVLMNLLPHLDLQ